MKLGLYRHFKGKEYEVIGIARDCETLKEVVVYKALYESPGMGYGSLWVRDRANFEELVTRDGKTMPRFMYIG